VGRVGFLFVSFLQGAVVQAKAGDISTEGAIQVPEYVTENMF